MDGDVLLLSATLQSDGHVDWHMRVHGHGCSTNANMHALSGHMHWGSACRHLTRHVRCRANGDGVGWGATPGWTGAQLQHWMTYKHAHAIGMTVKHMERSNTA